VISSFPHINGIRSNSQIFLFKNKVKLKYKNQKKSTCKITRGWLSEDSSITRQSQRLSLYPPYPFPSSNTPFSQNTFQHQTTKNYPKDLKKKKKKKSVNRGKKKKNKKKRKRKKKKKKGKKEKKKNLKKKRIKKLKKKKKRKEMMR